MSLYGFSWFRLLEYHGQKIRLIDQVPSLMLNIVDSPSFIMRRAVAISD